MEKLSRSSESVVVITTPPAKPRDESFAPTDASNVPIELYGYFGLDLSLDDRTQKYLSEIARSTKGETVGDRLQYLRSIENKLGVPHAGESRIGRLWNYLKLTGKIEDLQKQQEALANRSVSWVR